jgi:hypothetical protein
MWRATAILLLCGCASSRPAPSAADLLKAMRTQVEFDRWPAENPPLLYAGIDLLETIPPELERADLVQDDFEYVNSWQVVTRTIRWRIKGALLTVVCGVGTGTPQQTRLGLLAVLASHAPGGLKLRLDAASPIPRIVAPDPREATALCRANIFLAVFQSTPVALDPAPLLQEWEQRIHQQPSLLASLHLVPRITEIRPSANPASVKKDSRIIFTLKVDSTETFLPAGIQILENNRRLTWWRIPVHSVHLGIEADAEGAFTLCLWVANRRQLAAVSMQNITVK